MKIIKVENCKGCPYYEEDCESQYCKELQKYITYFSYPFNSNRIYKECPLEDYKGE